MSHSMRGTVSIIRNAFQSRYSHVAPFISDQSGHKSERDTIAVIFGQISRAAPIGMEQLATHKRVGSIFLTAQWEAF